MLSYLIQILFKVIYFDLFTAVACKDNLLILFVSGYFSDDKIRKYSCYARMTLKKYNTLVYTKVSHNIIY